MLPCRQKYETNISECTKLLDKITVNTEFYITLLLPFNPFKIPLLNTAVVLA